MRPLRHFVFTYADDLLAWAGTGCVLYGVAQWSRPAAWVTAGIILLALALWPALRAR